MKSFKQISHNYKINNQSQIFITDVSLILKEYESSNYQFNIELLTHVLNLAEQFFIYGTEQERKNNKDLAINSLMKIYFRNDEDLLNSMITTVWTNVKKSNYFKRSWQKFKNFFLKNLN